MVTLLDFVHKLKVGTTLVKLYHFLGESERVKFEPPCVVITLHFAA